MYQRTYNVFVSKTGTLHVASQNQDYASSQHVTTWGVWKNGAVRGPFRSLRLAGLAPAGVLVRTEVDREFSFDYNADAPHV